MRGDDEAHSGAPAGRAVLRVLRLALHSGFFLLLGIATARMFTGRGDGTWTYAAVGGAVLLAAVYCAGSQMLRRRRPAQVWLAAVTAIWAALLAASPAFSWVAFPLFFIHLHLLRRLHAVGAVGVITALVIAAQVWHAGQLQVAIVLGPVIGALFAVVITMGYGALYTESEQRRRLIEDLTRTRAELAASQHEAGMLAERERLAREIHDTLAQGLSSIVLLLRSAENENADSHEASVGRIKEARETASDNLAEARRFVRDLSPPSLAGNSLTEALRRLCERTGRESGIDCAFHVDGEPGTAPPGHDVALLRAAQASLANVTAHAQGSAVVVTLGFLESEITLDVYDDGVGFDTAVLERPGPESTGYGLPALRERIAGIGGRLDVESTPGEGTAIAIRLPLPVAEST